MDKQWLTTGDIGRLTGYTDRWVQRQIEAGRLPATAFIAGKKVTYRVRTIDFEAFRTAYLRETGRVRP